MSKTKEFGVLLFLQEARQPVGRRLTGIDQRKLCVDECAHAVQQVELLEDEAHHLVAQTGEFIVAQTGHVAPIEEVGAGIGAIEEAQEMKKG